MESKRILLDESEIPKAWYNLQADLPEPVPPPIHPVTHQPLPPEQLEPIFARALLEQETSTERWIPIPEEVLRVLAIWRPHAISRNICAPRPASISKTRVTVRRAATNPTPRWPRPGTTRPRACAGSPRRPAPDSGAARWALPVGCSIWSVRCSWCASAGRRVLETDPDCPGSLGIAISEAVEQAISREDTRYALGSVLNHVMLHQTIIGLETEKQLELAGDFPDVVIGCVGGGSNFAGLAFPFLRHRLQGKQLRFIACEPHACPTMSRGQYRYDYGDTAGLTPLMRMHTLGHNFVPPGIHAGGLRYHGMAPMVSLCARLGLIEARACHQLESFEAARLFAATEGIIPAPETSHALRAVIEEAERCRQTGEEKCIVCCFSGHGLCDLGAYDKFLAGELQDYAYPQEKIEAALAELPEDL